MQTSSIVLAISGSGGLVALAVEAIRTFRGRGRERLELTEAISKAPLVRQSLELGNFDQAVKTLLAINTSQAAHIDRQDVRIDELEADNTRCHLRIDELERILAEWAKPQPDAGRPAP